MPPTFAPEVEATHAAATVNLPAPGAGKALVITEAVCSYSAAPTGGKFSISDVRTDAGCTVSATSPVVLDASIRASDTGRAVTSSHIPANAVVGLVVPGVSFEIFVAGVATNGTGAATEAVTLAATFTFAEDVALAGPTKIELGTGVEAPQDRALAITVADGGAGIVGRVNVGYEVIEA